MCGTSLRRSLLSIARSAEAHRALHLEASRKQRHVLCGSAEAQIPDGVEVQAPRAPFPQTPHAVTADQHLERVNVLRADDAHGTAARTGGDGVRLDHGDRRAALRQRQGGGHAQRSGADHNDVERCHATILPGLIDHLTVLAGLPWR
jgi:hypothetical protein